VQIVNGFLSAIGRLWARGCLGKGVVIFGALFVMGLCGSIFGRGRAPTAIAPAVLVATSAALLTEKPAERPTATIAPAAPATAALVASTDIPTELPTATATITPTLTAQPTAKQLPAATVKPIPTAAPALQSTDTPAPVAENFDRNGDGKVTCKDFTTQAEAQRALEAGQRQLDGNDKDGRACESLP
jgi:hypothetical protein